MCRVWQQGDLPSTMQEFLVAVPACALGAAEPVAASLWGSERCWLLTLTGREADAGSAFPCTIVLSLAAAECVCWTVTGAMAAADTAITASAFTASALSFMLACSCTARGAPGSVLGERGSCMLLCALLAAAYEAAASCMAAAFPALTFEAAAPAPLSPRSCACVACLPGPASCPVSDA